MMQQRVRAGLKDGKFETGAASFAPSSANLVLSPKARHGAPCAQDGFRIIEVAQNRRPLYWHGAPVQAVDEPTMTNCRPLLRR